MQMLAHVNAVLAGGLFLSFSLSRSLPEAARIGPFLLRLADLTYLESSTTLTYCPVRGGDIFD